MNKMYINTETKLTILNTLVVGISLTNVEDLLKISLLLISIIYTVFGIREKILNIKKLRDGSDNNREDKNTPS